MSNRPVDYDPRWNLDPDRFRKRPTILGVVMALLFALGFSMLFLGWILSIVGLGVLVLEIAAFLLALFWLLLALGLLGAGIGGPRA